jgi:hypothetical protein
MPPGRNELFCRAAKGALVQSILTDLLLTTATELGAMARLSRISETYRRRLRLSSRDVLIAIAVTLLAGAVIAATVWKRPSRDAHTAYSIQSVGN